VKRRDFITLVGGAAAWPLAARAQQGGKKYLIGRFAAGSPDHLTDVLTQALRELGWVEGENVVFERRYAENRLERLPEMAADLVRLKVDVIVAGATLAPLAAKRATSTIPIILSSCGDPLGTGLVTTLARPGGNVTGMSLMGPDLGGKRLQLLKELLPQLASVAVLWNAATPNSAIVLEEVQEAGQRLAIEVQSLEVRSPDDFDGAFETARKQRPDAMITADDPLTLDYRKRIADFAAEQQLPSIHALREFAADGGLMSYGPNIADVVRRAAGYVDKILKGAKPADLPVQQPTKFDLVINLKTAKAIGITIPPSLLARGDRIAQSLPQRRMSAFGTKRTSRD
jgi:putative tryptophan/tyrosine transport system substrate-binding protein